MSQLDLSLFSMNLMLSLVLFFVCMILLNFFLLKILINFKFSDSFYFKESLNENFLSSNKFTDQMKNLFKY